jgi:hypothetical protein
MCSVITVSQLPKEVQYIFSVSFLLPFPRDILSWNLDLLRIISKQTKGRRSVVAVCLVIILTQVSNHRKPQPELLTPVGV